MSGRAIIIFLIGVIAVATLAFNNIANITNSSSSTMGDYYQVQLAQNVSQSGMSIALQRLQSTSPWSALYNKSFTVNPLLNGWVTYSFKNTVFNGVNCVKITSNGSVGTSTAVNVVYVRPPLPGNNLQSNVKGAVGAATNISVLGNLTIDGENHNIDGTSVIGGSGTYAIWTTAAVDFTRGSGQVGGTIYNAPPPDPKNPTGGTDWIPRGKKDYNTDVIMQGQSGPLFSGPDSVFGYPRGTLRDIAKNGGGQYIKNPAIDKLTYPLWGVTYVDLPNGYEWDGANLSGSGVVVVHSEATNAVIKNTTGKFSGLVISDDVVHVHSTIVGALVVLTQAPTEGNCVGNGTGSILYSRQALTNAENITQGKASVKDNRLAWWKGSNYMYDKVGPKY